LGGRRICIGKTFAETTSKYAVARFLSNFKNMEFVDKKNYETITRNNAIMLKDPILMI
jgi:cytochrome P450